MIFKGHPVVAAAAMDASRLVWIVSGYNVKVWDLDTLDWIVSGYNVKVWDLDTLDCF